MVVHYEEELYQVYGPFTFTKVGMVIHVREGFVLGVGDAIAYCTNHFFFNF